MKTYFKYLKSLLLHKLFVFQAGIRLKVPIWRLIIHDWSKFTPSEFQHYARHFHGEKSDATAAAFAYAWLHHENHNPHHWGYWIPRSGKYAGKPLEMPETYVREMLADWMGANRTYRGTWDMSAWLAANGPALTLHENTNRMIHLILMDEQRYFLTDNCDWSFMRGQA